ncbi:MAG: SufB/SufD family protein [Treponemataceae bacterium]
MANENIDTETGKLLTEISDYDGSEFKGAYNIRVNCKLAQRKSTENILIDDLPDGKPGLKITVKPGTKNEQCYIPACVTKSGVEDLTYNDFYIGEDADITIIAGCGVHTETGEPARHNGVHRFFLGKNSRVLYLEKHLGTGGENSQRSIDPITEAELGEGSYLEMNTSQIGGVDKSIRKTNIKVGKDATLIIKESLLTDKEEFVESDFYVEMNGDDSRVNLISRSVAKGNSRQVYKSNIVGNAKCSGHSECDAILADHGVVSASPQLTVATEEATLIHEAAIGKIAGEQILKLRTLGLTEEQAEQKIIEGFLK